jgi:hypothetical protein
VFDASKADKKFLGHTVQPDATLPNNGFERILITAIENVETVRKRLGEYQIGAEKIVTIK